MLIVLLSSVVRNVGDGANGVVGSVYHSESGLPVSCSTIVGQTVYRLPRS
jgi:hypothetical protein